MSAILSLGGMEDNAVLGGTAGEEQVGDVHSLRLGASASQHAAVTRATVTCRPTAGARPTTARTNWTPWEWEDNEI